MAKIGPIARLDGELTYGKFLAAIIAATSVVTAFGIRSEVLAAMQKAGIDAANLKIEAIARENNERYQENRDWRVRTEERLRGIESAVKDLPNHTFTVRNEK